MMHVTCDATLATDKMTKEETLYSRSPVTARVWGRRLQVQTFEGAAPYAAGCLGGASPQNAESLRGSSSLGKSLG